MGKQDLASNDRAEALQAAKLAVRAYARDPSSENEADVEEALRRIRRLTARRGGGDRRPFCGALLSASRPAR
jgi:hypothetical protein